MRWRKLGLLYTPRGVHPKLATHAANPLPILLEGDVYRVLFSGRDSENRSSVGYVDIDLAQAKVVYVHDQPVFEHGPPDSYYSHGVSIGNCYEAGGQRYIGFMAWQARPGQHWRGDIGRLVLAPTWEVRLDGDRPFLGIDSTDPISLSYPWVLRDPDGTYRMWYGSTVAWDAGNGEMLHVIKHAESQDGNRWQRLGPAVPYQLGVAQAFSHPTVVGSAREGFDMWFSYRGAGGTYRIGYASKRGGETWELRCAEAGIDVSPLGWDSEMIEYPFVFDHKGERYMLFNGNGYGRTGFGLAVLERA
jgi:hypothetical protein